MGWWKGRRWRATRARSDGAAGALPRRRHRGERARARSGSTRQQVRNGHRARGECARTRRRSSPRPGPTAAARDTVSDDAFNVTSTGAQNVGAQRRRSMGAASNARGECILSRPAHAHAHCRRCHECGETAWT